MIYKAQRYQLRNRKEEPWRVSLDAHLAGGVSPGSNVGLFNPDLKGNWGLFSTQFRYNRIFDNTGILTTFDWQVLQFNFLNSKSAKIYFGLGFSQEIEIEQAHFEKTGGLQLFFKDRTFAPSFEYRWSGNGIPRREFQARFEYRLTQEKNFGNAVFLGYTHQNYYRVPFNFLAAGVTFFIE